jgi:anti-sigma28 factor (negative regulator of flagellin synthesis)
MKVYDRNMTGASAADAGRTQEAQKAQSTSSSKTAGAAGAGSSDSVQLSSTLGSLSRAMSSFSSDRSAKIQSLTAQYQSGSYNADSAAISTNMVSEAIGASAR